LVHTRDRSERLEEELRSLELKLAQRGDELAELEAQIRALLAARAAPKATKSRVVHVIENKTENHGVTNPNELFQMLQQVPAAVERSSSASHAMANMQTVHTAVQYVPNTDSGSRAGSSYRLQLVSVQSPGVRAPTTTASMPGSAFPSGTSTLPARTNMPSVGAVPTRPMPGTFAGNQGWATMPSKAATQPAVPAGRQANGSAHAAGMQTRANYVTLKRVWRTEDVVGAN
jgi:hypothetical protein